MTAILLSSAAGAAAGALWWWWLRTGAYRYPSDVTRLDLRRSWTVIVLAAAGGTIAGAAPADLLPAAWVYLVVGAALVWIDLDVHRIPDAIVRWWAPALAAVLVVTTAVTGSWEMLAWASGAAAGLGGLFFVVAMFSQLGLGDVKLAAVTGLVVGPLGWDGVVTAVFSAYVVAAAAAVVQLGRGASRRLHVAFGPGIVAGAGIALAVSIAPF